MTLLDKVIFWSELLAGVIAGLVICYALNSAISKAARRVRSKPGTWIVKLLHKTVFWSHLLAGMVARLVIFLMSFTGVVLMYESQVTEYVERGVRRAQIPRAARRQSSSRPIRPHRWRSTSAATRSFL